MQHLDATPVKARKAVYHEGLRFAAVGVVNTTVSFIIILSAKPWIGILAANALGYACGIAISFLLNRRWTFGHTGGTRAAIIGFSIVTAVAFVSNLVVISSFQRAGFTYLVAQLAGSFSYTAISFVGLKFGVFRKS
ncbi:MAG: GtrA family protein [Rhodobacteraceae bacterium]|nr:GtrA family protein [Paracoccaceae bacterium]